MVPLDVLPSAPMVRSADPLVTLIPSFVIMFCLWSLVFFILAFSIKRLKRGA